MPISKITTRGFNFANTLSRGDFTDTSFGDIVLLENEDGALLMDASASGVDVEGHILYNNNESAFFFRDISSTQLSDGAVTLSKISSDTKDQLNEDHIALENEDGNLLLNSSAVSTDEGDRVVYDAIFVDKLNLFNINTLGSSGQALKVNNAGNDFTFGSAGTHVKLSANTVSTAVSEISFANTFADNSSFRVFYILGEGLEGAENAYRNWRFSTDGSSGDTGNYSWAIDGRQSQNNAITWYTTGQNYATLQDDTYYAYGGYAFGFNGYVHIPTKTDVASHFAGITFGERNSNDAFYNNFVGAPHSTTTPTGIIFYSASGNYTDGTITVYGVTQ